MVSSQRPKILIVGALPPPAIGPYLAMERLVNSQKLLSRFDILFLDISDRRSIRSMGQFDFVNCWLAVRHAFECTFKLLFQNPSMIYLGISQGTMGYLRDLTFLLPAILLRKRVVLHLRGSEFGAFYKNMSGGLRWLTRWVMGNTTRVIVLGDCLRNTFRGLVEEDRISVIPNGIAYDAFASDRARATINKKPNGKILYLAHLSRRKGFLLVIQAFAEIVEKHSSATLTVAGQWQGASEEAEARELIRKLGLSEKIEFLGEITGQNKIDTFCAHDLFVFPPIAPEGLPWVILEAMSAGLPVVTTDQGAIREVVVDGITGKIVDPVAHNVAVALLWMLENPKAATTLGEAGLSRVKEQFSEDRYLERLVGLFEQVCSKR